MEYTALEGQKQARWPIHPSRPHKVVNMHEPTNSKLMDPFHWIEASMSEEDKTLFKREEEEYY